MNNFRDLPTKKLYSNAEILARIQAVGKQISADYQDQPILVIGLLKGCTIFMAHLLVNIATTTQIDFMTISSYKQGTKSNEFKFIQDLDTEVHDKHVLIVEDIIDSGRTINFVHEHLLNRGAKSIEIAVLINKLTNLQYDIPPIKYKAFDYNQKEFLVGFGFDLDGHFRNLPDIYQLLNTGN